MKPFKSVIVVLITITILNFAELLIFSISDNHTFKFESKRARDPVPYSCDIVYVASVNALHHFALMM